MIGSLTVERLGREQSNTSVLIGDEVILKGLRRIERGYIRNWRSAAS